MGPYARIQTGDSQIECCKNQLQRISLFICRMPIVAQWLEAAFIILLGALRAFHPRPTFPHAQKRSNDDHDKELAYPKPVPLTTQASVDRQ